MNRSLALGMIYLLTLIANTCPANNGRKLANPTIKVPAFDNLPKALVNANDCRIAKIRQM